MDEKSGDSVDFRGGAVSVLQIESVGEGASGKITVAPSEVQYRTYKRRFVGWLLLAVDSLMVNWSWVAFAPVVDTVSEYFGTDNATINWFSTTWLFCAVAASFAAPFAFRRGPKFSMMVGAVLMLLSSWLKYAGTRVGNLGLAMFGQMLSGCASPFLLYISVLYSNLWFSPGTRAVATAVPSVMGVFGGVMASLVTPAWVKSPEDLTTCVLGVSLITTAFAVPTLFIPKGPPTPPSPATHPEPERFLNELKWVLKSPETMMLCCAFGLSCGVFNSFTTLYYQFLLPFGISATSAGVGNALLMAVGVVASFFYGALADATKKHVWIIRISTIFNTASIITFIWVPRSQNLGFVYALACIQSITLVGPLPVIQELLVEIVYPRGCGTALTIFWSLGNFMGGVFIIAMSYMVDGQGTLMPAIYLQTALMILSGFLYFSLGLFGRSEHVKLKRWAADQAGNARRDQSAVSA